jgi:hypothetical protein
VNPLTNAVATNSGTMPQTANPNGVIAAFWDDLVPAPGSSVKTDLQQVGGHQVRIFQWTRFRPVASASSFGAAMNDSFATFQIQLWSNGDVVTAYKDIVGTNPLANNWMRGAGTYGLLGATFGIENSTATAGNLYAYNRPVLYPGLSLLYRPR